MLNGNGESEPLFFFLNEYQCFYFFPHCFCWEIRSFFFFFLQKTPQWQVYTTMLCLVTQLCLTVCNPMDYSLPGSSVHGDSPGKNTGVGCHALLQGIFPTHGLIPGLWHCRRILYHLSPQGNSVEWTRHPCMRWTKKKECYWETVMTTSPNGYSAKSEMLPKWELLS